jgi:ribosomal protein L37E
MSKPHPFEISGDRVGPFRLVAVISTPARALAEKNPRAYNHAVQQCWTEARSFNVVLHQCSHCGQGLAHNAVVRDSRGHHFVVGLDCAGRVGDASLGDAAKIEIARIKREADQKKREAKREANHQKWLDTVCYTGETNRDRLAREQDEWNARLESKRVNQKLCIDILGPVAVAIRDGKGGFRDSVASSILTGELPTGRAQHLVAEIYAKQHGRRNSAAYDGAFSEVETLFAQYEREAVA